MHKMAAKNVKPLKGTGPSPEVAREFVKKTPKKGQSIFKKKG